MNGRSLGFFIIVFIYLAQYDAYAQRTPEDFLLTAYDDINLLEFSNQVEFLDQKSYRIPFGDEVEIRFSNDQRVLDDARFQFRFRPSNPWFVRRNNALFNAKKDELSLREQIEYKENLFRRYSDLLEFIISEREKQLTEQRLENASRLVEVFEATTQTDLFDARDYIDAKLQVIETLEDYDEHRISATQIHQKIELILGSETDNWSGFNLIEIQTIEDVMHQVLASSFDPVELNYLTKQYEVANLEVRTEKADFDIGFVQAEYSPYRDPDENVLGFSVGLTLPIFRNNKAQIAERMLDSIERDGELRMQEYQDSLNKILETKFLEDQLSHHKMIRQQVEELNIAELSQNLAISENFDPVSLLELEDGKIKLEELLLSSLERLLEQYLEFLFTFDALTSKPLRNYLSNDLQSLE